MTSIRPNGFAALPPHLIIDDAFGRDLADRLLAFAQAREEQFAESTFGNRVRKTDIAVRSSRTMRDFGDLTGEVDARFRAMLPRAIGALGLTPFALAGLSMEMAAHGDRDFYRRHIDTFTGSDRAGRDRALTGVYYFNATPKGFSGGELRLHSIRPAEQGGTCTDIEPVHDRLLLFPAWAPHEVLPVSLPGGAFAQSRFAINCWYNREAAAAPADG
jgi:SM-20-related protein